MESRSGLPVIHRAQVKPEWIDYNGHFNAGYYAVVFDDSVTDWMTYCGLSREHKQSTRTTSFSVESHTLYLRELRLGDPLEITGQLLDFTDKKVHSFLRMFHGDQGFLAATYELMTLHIDLATRRPGPMHPSVVARLEAVRKEQAALDRPPQAGRIVSVEAKRPALL